MNIILNGDKITLSESLSVSDLLTHLALEGKRLAVEINEHIVPRSKHRDTKLENGDIVEIIHAVGGG